MGALHTRTLHDLAGLLETGACSSVEIVDDLLGAIAARDSRIGAYLHLDPDAARAAAAQADAARRDGSDAPLLGLPIAIKDVLNVKGQPCTCSSKILEGKLILAKDIGKFNLAYNQVIKEGISNDGRTEHKYDVGLNYEFNPRWKVGIESMGSYTDDKYYLGPTVSWSSRKIWAGIGAVGVLNDQSDDLQVRVIVGIPF